MSPVCSVMVNLCETLCVTRDRLAQVWGRTFKDRLRAFMGWARCPICSVAATSRSCTKHVVCVHTMGVHLMARCARLHSVSRGIASHEFGVGSPRIAVAQLWGRLTHRCPKCSEAGTSRSCTKRIVRVCVCAHHERSLYGLMREFMIFTHGIFCSTVFNVPIGWD